MSLKRAMVSRSAVSESESSYGEPTTSRCEPKTYILEPIWTYDEPKAIQAVLVWLIGRENMSERCTFIVKTLR